MASEESLIVKLKADTANLERGLERVESDLASVIRQTNKADKGMSAFSSTAKAVGSQVGSMATSIAGATAVLTAFTLQSANSQKELIQMADVAQTSTDRFEELAFATAKYNLDVKGTADAMNDVSERLGEFSAAASGAFQDYADVMGLTKDQAQSLATELQELEPSDAITFLVAQMEEANIATAQQSFVLKSLSNDLEYIAPLYRNNAEELRKLTEEHRKLTDGLELTEGQSEDLAEFSKTWSKLTTQLAAASKVVSADLAPILTEFFEWVSENVPSATDAIGDFLDEFKRIDQLSARGLTREIEEVEDQLTKTINTVNDGVWKTEQVERLRDELIQLSHQATVTGVAVSDSAVSAIETANSYSTLAGEIESLNVTIDKLDDVEGILSGLQGSDVSDFKNFLSENEKAIDGFAYNTNASYQENYYNLVKYLDESKAVLSEQLEAMSIEAADKPVEIIITPKVESSIGDTAVDTSNTSISVEDVGFVGPTTDGQSDYYAELIAQEEQFLLTKEELQQQYRDREIEKVLEAQESLSDIALSRYEQGLISEKEYQDRINEIQEDAANKTEEIDEILIDSNENKEASNKDYVNAAMDVNSAFFDDNKAVGAGLIVANTAIGVSEGVKLGFPAAIPAVAAAVAQGAAALASLNSASKGGGSLPNPTAAPTTPEAPEPELVASNIDTSGNGTSGNLNEVIIKFDESTELGVLLNNSMIKAKQDGLI